MSTDSEAGLSPGRPIRADREACHLAGGSRRQRHSGALGVRQWVTAHGRTSRSSDRTCSITMTAAWAAKVLSPWTAHLHAAAYIVRSACGHLRPVSTAENEAIYHAPRPGTSS